MQSTLGWGASWAIEKGVRDTVGLISAIFRRKRVTELPGTDLLREETSEPLLRVTKQLLTAGRNDRALALLRVGTLRFPNDTELTGLLAGAERDEASPQIEGSLVTLEANPCAKNHARVSQLFRRIGDIENAIEQGRASISLGPQRPYGYRAIGKVYLDRFRVDAQTVDGMNALRYFSKACALDPRHADSLIALAEIFVILRAPDAARRFLAPISESLPGDPTVEILERRCRDIPKESTSNVQELFLDHERAINGESVDKGRDNSNTLDVPTDLSDRIETLVAKIDGTSSLWVVDDQRQVVGGHGLSDNPEEQQIDDLGLSKVTLSSSRLSLLYASNVAPHSVATNASACRAADGHLLSGMQMEAS